MKPTSFPSGETATANITKRIQELGDWRGETLAHVRQLIHDADPGIQEEWKWRGGKYCKEWIVISLKRSDEGASVIYNIMFINSYIFIWGTQR